MKKTVSVQERVAELVREHGSYRAAAESIGIDHAYLYRIGNHEKIPRALMLERLGLCSERAYYERLQS